MIGLLLKELSIPLISNQTMGAGTSGARHDDNDDDDDDNDDDGGDGGEGCDDDDEEYIG